MNRVKLSPRRRSPSIRSNELVSYRNIVLLRRFISEHGRIFSRRINRLTSKQQRSVSVAIKRARIPALPPFSSNEN
uniref:ribosomal protein S18 n=1 Tax=Schizaea medusa TaxID=2939619 RepID=UPI002113BEA6|nr:ribosomal protein S18 [Schizaea medusa]YP_010444890.1 ribosomal protein S18 [Schizaea poeppigiana]YP_010445004.1 ribosomal protein S18 [Schizaea sprucei]UTJ90189.1 ribosomal protein S18 [Schizaea medusa]UTJ90435.1 ribosomal protein S18 [Schizaea poeppigiana]UTJ90517.1 ribosomal protein S18 [Schizaea sprucei]